MTEEKPSERWIPGPYYFVIVGIFVGVVFTSAMAAENIWQLFRDTVFMIGAIGTAVGVFVAIRIAQDQIAAAKTLEDERKRHLEHLSALKLYAALFPHQWNFVALADLMTRALSDPDVEWDVDQWWANVKRDSDGRVHRQLRTYISKWDKIDLIDQAIILGRSEPRVVEWSSHLENNIATFLRNPEEETLAFTHTFLSEKAVKFTLLAIRNYCDLFCWLEENFDIISEEEASVVSPRIRSHGWPMDEDILTLTEVNPPESWGAYLQVVRELAQRNLE